jgi:hypothetical protein
MYIRSEVSSPNPICIQFKYYQFINYNIFSPYYYENISLYRIMSQASIQQYDEFVTAVMVPSLIWSM